MKYRFWITARRVCELSHAPLQKQPVIVIRLRCRLALINLAVPPQCRCSQVYWEGGTGSSRAFKQAEALNTRNLGSDALVFIGKTPRRTASVICLWPGLDRVRSAEDDSVLSFKLSLCSPFVVSFCHFQKGHSLIWNTIKEDAWDMRHSGRKKIRFYDGPL